MAPDQKLMAVAVNTASNFEASTPQALGVTFPSLLSAAAPSGMSVHHCQTDPRRLGRRMARSTASTSCLMESAMVWRAGSPSCMRARSSASSLMRLKGAVSEKSGDGGTPRAYTGAKDSVCQILNGLALEPAKW